MRRIKQRAALGLLLMCLAACSRTVVFKQENQAARPLKTEAKIIRLHEDFLHAEQGAQQLKQLVIQNIKQAMAEQQRFQFELIPSGRKVPANNGNQASVFLIGDIRMHQERTSANQVRKVTRSKISRTSRQKWDELERVSWKQDSLQTVVSLYFIEVGSETRLLRSTITVSNDKKDRKQAGGRTIYDRQRSQFYKDGELQPGFGLVSANTNINLTEKALAELAGKAVKRHFDSL